MTKPKLTDRERHLATVHARRTPADRARLLAERLAEVAAMRRGGRLAPYPAESQIRQALADSRTWTASPGTRPTPARTEARS